MFFPEKFLQKSDAECGCCEQYAKHVNLAPPGYEPDKLTDRCTVRWAASFGPFPSPDPMKSDALPLSSPSELWESFSTLPSDILLIPGFPRSCSQVEGFMCGEGAGAQVALRKLLLIYDVL